MDIYTAESAINKLLTYVKDLDKASPKMYEKSKRRLKDLYSACTEVVEVISSILQKESISVDNEEFGSLISQDVGVTVQNIQEEVQKLSRFVGAPVSDLSADAKKRILANYGNTIKAVAGSCKTKSAKDCASLIWRWFETRFFRKGHGNFHYNITQIPKWIEAFVLIYGKHLSNHTESSFEAEISNWLDEVVASDNFNYAVPYPIYQVSQNIAGDDFSLEAIVLWDILADSGYSSLYRDPNLPLPPDHLYKMCEEYSPETLNKYVRYTIDESVFSYCNVAR